MFEVNCYLALYIHTNFILVPKRLFREYKKKERKKERKKKKKLNDKIFESKITIRIK